QVVDPAAKPRSERLTVALASACAVGFALQFAVEDAVFRGAGAWLARPLVLGDVASSVLLGGLALVLVSASASRLARGAVAFVAAFLLVGQAIVFRYYHAPLDVQVAASALFAWHDVRQVVLRSALGSTLAISVVAALEYAALGLVRAHLAGRLPRPTHALLAA